MVTVDLFRDADGCLNGFSSKGHAGYAAAGQDIVCAAISAILQTAVLGITDRLGLDVAFTMEEGEMTLHLLDPLSKAQKNNADLILDTMRLGLKSLAMAQSECIQIQEWR